jgi:hypothetical protein
VKPTPNELLGLYAEWRDLTGAESVAIRSERWDVVTELQRRKADLQGRVEAVSGRHLPGSAALADLAPLIHELMTLEADNARLMDGKLEVGRQQRADLDRSGSNLRRLRGSYGQARATTWQSYS